MKQKDIVLIVVIVVISGVISFVVSGKLIVPSKNLKQEAEVVKPISAQFNKPDKRYFNSNSINPTKLIQIGQNNNPDPFRGGDGSQ